MSASVGQGAPLPVTAAVGQIPAALWFLARDRSNHRFRNRTGERLFIDARNMGELINRRTRVLTPQDIATISNTYHNWRNVDGNYADVKGFCASVPLAPTFHIPRSYAPTHPTAHDKDRMQV